ncbi:MAG: CPBP family glutamic-type intramembrane protease [Verrucomicrobiota bacterium]
MWNRIKYPLEIIVTLTGGIGYAVFHQRLAFNAWFIVPLLFVLVLYAYLESRFGDRDFAYFGVRTDNLKDATRLSCMVLGPILLGLTIYALINGVHHPLHFFYALMLYPIWGLIQQFVFQGIFLNACKKVGLGYFSILLAAFAYTIVHYPSMFMIKFTALGGLLFAGLFYFRPNIIPLGIFHGIFGAFLYYVLRDKDPFEKLLDKL